MAKYVILDTETTDLNEQWDAQIVGIGRLYLNESFQDQDGLHEELFKPRAPKKISFQAMAVHHITHGILSDKECFDESHVLARLKSEIADGCIVIGHNVKFDLSVLSNYGIDVPDGQYIDTMRVAKHVYSDNDEIESWSLQYLRYALGVQKDIEDTGFEIKAHDAGSDVIVTHLLLLKLVGKVMSGWSGDTTHNLISLTKQPVKVKKLNFGKYKGKHISQLPYIDKQYLSWLSNNAEDEDVRYTAKLHARR